MAFRKIARAQIDETRVTLGPIRDGDGSLHGRVETLVLNEHGEVEKMTTELADPPIRDAIVLAVQLADFKEQDVDVTIRIFCGKLLSASWNKVHPGTKYDAQFAAIRCLRAQRKQ